MIETKVPSDQWGKVFAEFTRRHLEEFVKVRLVDAKLGEQLISDGDLPFQGVSFLGEEGSDLPVRVALGQEAVSDPDSVAHQIKVREVVLVKGDQLGEETLILVSGNQKLFIEAKPQEVPLLA